MLHRRVRAECAGDGHRIRGRLGQADRRADVMATQPDPAHHIHFEEPAPIVIADFFERLRFENSDIVHQNIDRREPFDGRPHSGFRPQVRRETVGRAARAHSFPGARFGAAVHDDRRAFIRQRCRDRRADSGRRARHQRGLTFQFEIHNDWMQFAADKPPFVGWYPANEL